jgi:hypothetical protein
MKLWRRPRFYIRVPATSRRVRRKCARQGRLDGRRNIPRLPTASVWVSPAIVELIHLTEAGRDDRGAKLAKAIAAANGELTAQYLELREAAQRASLDKAEVDRLADSKGDGEKAATAPENAAARKLVVATARFAKSDARRARIAKTMAGTLARRNGLVTEAKRDAGALAAAGSAAMAVYAASNLRRRRERDESMQRPVFESPSRPEWFDEHLPSCDELLAGMPADGVAT